MFGTKLLKFFSKKKELIQKNQKAILNKKSPNYEKTDTKKTSKQVRKVLGYSFLGIIGCMTYSEYMSKSLEIIYDKENEVSG